MSILAGLKTNWQGLKLGLATPRLLALGLIRFLLILALTVCAAILAFRFYLDIFSMLWTRPESAWIAWLWHLASWLAGLLLFGMASMVAYIVGQIAFAVLIMDLMAQATERIKTGKALQPAESSFFLQLFHLIRQETPRAIFPVVLTTLLMIAGWLTPLGPVLTVVMPVVSAVFLAWDNTDLIPARGLVPFKDRLRFLKKNLMFHVGFGLWFLVPGLNILFLSFAPVGGALFYIETQMSGDKTSTGAQAQGQGAQEKQSMERT